MRNHETVINKIFDTQGENVQSEKLQKAIKLLQPKQTNDGQWNLERRIHNMIISVGSVDKPNRYVTKRAKEVLDFYI